MKIAIIEGRNGSQTFYDKETLLIMEKLKTAFLRNLERRVPYHHNGDPFDAVFGFCFNDGTEVFFQIGNGITPETARNSWTVVKNSRFALDARLVNPNGEVFCKVYFSRVFDVDYHEDLQSLKRIINSANIPNLQMSPD